MTLFYSSRLPTVKALKSDSEQNQLVTLECKNALWNKINKMGMRKNSYPHLQVPYNFRG